MTGECKNNLIIVASANKLTASKDNKHSISSIPNMQDVFLYVSTENAIVQGKGMTNELQEIVETDINRSHRSFSKQEQSRK